MSNFEDLYSVTDQFTGTSCLFYEKNSNKIERKKLGVSVNFQLVDEGIEIALEELKMQKITPDKLDSFIGPALHFSLKDLPTHITNNSGLWSYLALIRFRKFAEKRAKVTENSHYDQQKWLGSPVFRDQSRHILRRVFNVCDVIVDKDKLKSTYHKSSTSYAHCAPILKDQEVMLQIGDRTLSLNKILIRQQCPVLVDIIKKSTGDKKKRIQDHFKRLHALSTTRLFSYLDASDLKNL